MPLDGTSATAGGETAPGVATFSHPVRRWTSDDLNYFFHRQQVERSRAATAPSAAARAVHRRLAQLYEEAIEQVTESKVRFRRRWEPLMVQSVHPERVMSAKGRKRT